MIINNFIATGGEGGADSEFSTRSNGFLSPNTPKDFWIGFYSKPKLNCSFDSKITSHSTKPSVARANALSQRFILGLPAKAAKVKVAKTNTTWAEHLRGIGVE